jgi:hypothetical protein
MDNNFDNNDFTIIEELTETDSLIEVKPKLKLFAELKFDEKPVVPLPQDTFIDVYYPQYTETRCSICSSPFRTLAEHVYLESGKKPQATIKFFEKHFNARLNWAQVKTHMDAHCDFRKVSVSGLKGYEQREEMIAPWVFREHQLALIALMTELDEVRGIDCGKNNELKLKRSAMVEKLIARIMDLKEKRDNAGVLALNIFEILINLHERLVCADDKRIVSMEIKTLRDRLQQEN